MAEKIKLYVMALAAVLFLGSCNKGEKPLPETPAEEGSAMVQDVYFSLPEIPLIEDEPLTRVSFDVDASSNFSFTWAANDTLGVCPASGSQIYFVADDPTSATVHFDGGGWALKNNSDYYSYVPFVGDIYLDKTKVPVDLTGQRQNGSGTPQDNMRAILACKGTLSGSSLSFNYRCVNCYLRITATLPAGRYVKMVLQTDDPLFAQTGTVDLTQDTPSITGTTFGRNLILDLENFNLSADGTVRAFIACAPVNLNGINVSVYFVDDSGVALKCVKTPSREYLANKLYGLTCLSFELADNFGIGVGGWGSGGSYSGTAH